VQPNLSGVTSVHAGGEHTLVRLADGTARAFGDNASGTLGNGSRTSSAVPVVVSQPAGIVAMSAGFNHSLALRADGTLYAFGFNSYGRLGDGTTTSRSTAVQVLGGVRLP
jgi:alpha-tubulin suppressor-like RCC1 family protein